jgi:hypothetical protein
MLIPGNSGESVLSTPNRRSGRHRVLRRAGMLAACTLVVASFARGTEGLSFGDVQNARPKDIRQPFLQLTNDELIDVVNENLKSTKVKTAGCNIEWEFQLDARSNLPYKTLTARVDSRDLNIGGGEVHNGRLLYHPETEGKKMHIVAPDGRLLLEDSWHTLEIRNASPERYWQAVGAFATMTERIAASCSSKTQRQR